MRILMIEDDEKLCEVVCYHLEREGVTVDVCHDGDDGLRWVRQQAHDLVILDRMLPTLSGTTVLEWMRADGISTPVLIVTALDAVADRVQGLNAGADDYLVKPFDLAELTARVQAMARRPRRWERPGPLRLGDVVFDPGQRILIGTEGECSLSKRESALLESLLRHPGQTFTREVLLSRVWGPDAPVEDGNLDNYVYFVRRRLRQVGSALEVCTVRGVGYRLERGHV